VSPDHLREIAGQQPFVPREESLHPAFQITSFLFGWAGCGVREVVDKAAPLAEEQGIAPAFSREQEESREQVGVYPAAGGNIREFP